MKRWKIVLPTLLATSGLPLVSLVGCGDPKPVEVYTIDGGNTKLSGTVGEHGGDRSAWVVKDSEGNTVAASLSIEGVSHSSDFPDWIQINDGKVTWTIAATKGTYKFKVKAIIEKADPIYSKEITLTINEKPIVEDFEFRFNSSTHEATLTKYNGKGGEVIIPSSVVKDGETYSVVSISNQVFFNLSSITSVVIPSSVKSIGTGAFLKCSKLESVTLSTGLETINTSAFGYCSTLTSITFPNTVTSIGFTAFNYCSALTSITFLNSATSIEEMAFNHCFALTSVVLPSNITSISNQTFSNCTSLTSVTIPSSVTKIGSSSFYGCSKLTDTSGPDNSCGFNFLGTVGQWEKVERGNLWHEGTNATKIQCTDDQCGLDDTSITYLYLANKEY